MSMPSTLLVSMIVVTMGMFHSSYTDSVANLFTANAVVYVEGSPEYVHLTYGFSNSIGYVLGIISSGFIANRYGRKKGLLINTIFGLSSVIFLFLPYVTCSVTICIIILHLGHLLLGVNSGMYTILVPLYVAEISPVRIRGALLIVTQLGFWMGSLVSSILFMQQQNGGIPVLFAIAIIPFMTHLILLPICPESPRYLLLTKKMDEKALKALQKLRASTEVENEFTGMRLEQIFEQSLPNISFCNICCSDLWKPLSIVLFMKIAAGYSGYYEMLKFYPNIVSWTTFTHLLQTTIGAPVIMLTIIAAILVDRIGRRKLQLYGLGGMFIFSCFFNLSIINLEFIIDSWNTIATICILIFAIFFAVGPSCLPEVITVELFTQGPRATALVITELIYLLLKFVGGFLYGFLNPPKVMGNYYFLIYTALLAIFWTIAFKLLPETKRKSFEEIAASFQQGDQKRENQNNSDNRHSIANGRSSPITHDGYNNTVV